MLLLKFKLRSSLQAWSTRRMLPCDAALLATERCSSAFLRSETWCFAKQDAMLRIRKRPHKRIRTHEMPVVFDTVEVAEVQFPQVCEPRDRLGCPKSKAAQQLGQIISVNSAIDPCRSRIKATKHTTRQMAKLRASGHSPIACSVICICRPVM